ncbi:methyltransferase domain-containing protein [Altererythrobacter sp. H2]|uniref:methyltransferase domain-containing protein n=1 Tax=Altererythrobacter sp. H2 TaxID=3108391 RepID=UPI002B4C033C|nr:methyltransferase domain-containing protein [Altererythrobacter sp. H2]WRK94414.1 methyltransferase domain-containing protein [Altererythrobacter sp. H2]
MQPPVTVPRIFSPERRRSRWQRAAARQGTGHAAGFLFEVFAEEIEDRLGFIRHEARTGLLIGDPSAQAARLLESRIPQLDYASPVTLDEEAVLPGRYDLLVSLGLLDTVNDVPGALLHIRHALEADGLAIIGLLGAGSLPALREALYQAEPDRPAARMHPMIDIRAAAALMQRAGFRRQVADHFPLKVRYGSLDRLVADLRDQGLTNALASAPPPLGKAAVDRARAAFLARADADGKVTETFELIVLTGWG